MGLATLCSIGFHSHFRLGEAVQGRVSTHGSKCSSNRNPQHRKAIRLLDSPTRCLAQGPARSHVSQQPGHLPPEIFELCNTRIVHTLRSMHNLEALIATTGDVSRELWARCPLLGQGQAVLSSPQLNRSVIVSMRPAACRRKFAH